MCECDCKSLSNLNKLPNTRVFVAAENGLVEVLELQWLYFSSRREPSVLKKGRRFPYMLYRALLRFFAKREGKIHSNFNKWKLFNLAPHSA